MTLPPTTDVIDALYWLRQGAPAAGKYHDAPKCVATLIQVLGSALPHLHAQYRYGTPEYYESIHGGKAVEQP